MSKLHKNMIIQLRVTVNSGTKDLSTATVKKLILSKPDGTVSVFDASFVTDGSDGVFYYATESADLNQVGIYNYQMYLEYTSNKIYSSIGNFRVYSNLAVI